MRSLKPALFLAAFVIVPFFLRRKSRVLRRVVIHARPGDIFPYLNELRNWPKWTEWSRREEMDYSYDGPESGVGAGQKWSSRRMHGEMRLLQSVPDEQVAYHTSIEDGKFHADGILTLEPLGNVTRVAWLARWDSGPNPFLRYRDLFMKWFLGRDFHAGLLNLKALVEDAKP